MSVKKSTVHTSENRLTQNQIWDRTSSAIDRGFRQSETAVIEALPATGKSYGVIEWAAKTGNKLTVLAPRHDLLDNEYEEWCEEWGLTYYRLPSFYRDCESFDENGEPIDEIARDLQAQYEKGCNGENLHGKFSNLPCQEHGSCSFVAERNANFDDVDVLLGTYWHAHTEQWIESRYVAFDEFPGEAYLEDLEGDVPGMVTAFLQDEEAHNGALPFKNYRHLAHSNPEEKEVINHIEGWKDNEKGHQYPFKSGHVQRSPNSEAHSMGAMATLAVLESNWLDNQWSYSNIGAGRKAVCSESEDWTFLLPPDLSPAESVIGLDGTPNIDLWELALNETIDLLQPLTQEEEKQYLSDVLGLNLIQTTEDWKAIQGGAGVSPPKDVALIEGISKREGQNPSFISSKEAIRQCKPMGLDQVTEMVENYGALKGMNDFSTERLGMVHGNSHPGDQVIKMWSAFAAHSAERKFIEGEEQSGVDTDYGEFGNRVMKTYLHDEVLQAAMRFGREEVDGVRGATVYIHTAAIPEWVPVEKQILEIDSWQTQKDGVPQVIEAIRSLSSWEDDVWKSTDLYGLTELSDRQVRSHLDSLADSGYIERLGKKGTGNTLHYANVCLDEAGVYGHVEFPN